MNLQTDAFKPLLCYFNGIFQFAFTGLVLDLFQAPFLNQSEFSLPRISNNMVSFLPALQSFQVSDAETFTTRSKNQSSFS